ncbi:MAG: uracil-DNA glycosylase [Bacteroidetes bacterium]|nr:uracil-DNA glycosylase [Bacteroidota bacterium]
MGKLNVNIEESWKTALQEEFNKPYFIQLVNHIKTEKELGKKIYPKGSLLFNAFNSTPLDKVKVVILGQDPYHGPGQAHGLSFSVQKGIPIPPSLQNIFKELQQDTGMPYPNAGDLSSWAKQGVFLLNASLTVREGEPMSHAKIGWANFTDAVIKTMSLLRSTIVFMLWGKFAQEKQGLIDASKHLILKAPHPSPLSAHQGFLGCGHFSSCNQYLVKQGVDPIDWHLR